MSPPLPIRAVSFDLDGTLYATGAHRLRLLVHLLPQLPLIRAWSAAVREARAARRDDLPAAIVAGIARRLNVGEDDAEARLWFFLDRTWIPSLRPSHVLPGIREALGMLDARGVPRAVASDHAPEGKLAALGLAEGWRAVLSAEALGALKPFPEVIGAAATAMGCPAGALLHVGDRADTDGGAAAAAGARYLGVLDACGSSASLPERLAAALDSARETA